MIIGGRLYEVTRAWRLVIYGKAAVALLRHVDIRHEEKVEKARLVMDHAGERWSNVEPLWLETVNRIKVQVSQYKAQARLEYIRKHGTLIVRKLDYRRPRYVKRPGLWYDGGREEGEVHIQSWRKNNLLLFGRMQSIIRQESPEIRASVEQSTQASHCGEL